MTYRLMPVPDNRYRIFPDLGLERPLERLIDRVANRLEEFVALFRD